MQEKKCTKCGITQSIDNFYSNVKANDGKRSDCKKCQKIAHKNYYKQNREEILSKEITREYRDIQNKKARDKYRNSRVETDISLRKNSLGDFPRKQSKIGYIYILTNPSYPEYVKIGKSVKLGMRLSTYNTGSPFRDYKYEFVLETEKTSEIESYFNNNFKSNNEWYKMSKEDAKRSIIDLI